MVYHNVLAILIKKLLEVKYSLSQREILNIGEAVTYTDFFLM